MSVNRETALPSVNFHFQSSSHGRLDADALRSGKHEVLERPESTSCILKIDAFYLVKHQGQEWRFATGELTVVTPLSGHGMETIYCDGSAVGTYLRKKRIPSCLSAISVKPHDRYPYAAWLSQIECACSATKDGRLLVPVLKNSNLG